MIIRGECRYAGAASVLIAWSPEDTEALKRSGIAGALVKLIQKAAL